MRAPIIFAYVSRLGLFRAELGGPPAPSIKVAVVGSPQKIFQRRPPQKFAPRLALEASC